MVKAQTKISLENKTQKIHWDFEREPDPHIPAGRLDLVFIYKKKKKKKSN